LALFVLLTGGFEQPDVRVESTDSVGPRQLEPQTQTSVVRDYLRAWQSLSRALEQNRTDLLDSDFLGVAKEQLTHTVQEQKKSGIKARYRDSSHSIKVLFYSPEGLSIQLLDTVEYDVELLDQDQVRGTRHIRSRYIAVLSPTEVRWKVRLLQAEN
jgi:hypothetical protein